MQQIRYMPRNGRIAIALAASMLAGCRGSQFPKDVAPALGSETQSVVLQVENHNWADIIIYVVHDGRRTRLNSVTATRNASLIIPPNLIGQVGDLQLVARRVGAYDRYVSQPLSVRLGSTIVLTLESDLARSSVAVW